MTAQIIGYWYEVSEHGKGLEVVGLAKGAQDQNEAMPWAIARAHAVEGQEWAIFDSMDRRDNIGDIADIDFEALESRFLPVHVEYGEEAKEVNEPEISEARDTAVMLACPSRNIKSITMMLESRRDLKGMQDPTLDDLLVEHRSAVDAMLRDVKDGTCYFQSGDRAPALLQQWIIGQASAEDVLAVASNEGQVNLKNRLEEIGVVLNTAPGGVSR